MVDMKVQVYSNFSKKNLWKKIKSPSFIKNGRFYPPNYRGKVQKMGVLYTPSPQMPSPSPNTKNLKFKKKNPKKLEIRGVCRKLPTVKQIAGSNQLATSSHPPTLHGYPNPPLFAKFSFFLLPTFSCTCGQLLVVDFSTSPLCPNFSKRFQTSITFDL